MDNKFLTSTQLIQYCASHNVVAYENNEGTVTMVEEFFFPPDYVEYHNISTLEECRKWLGY